MKADRRRHFASEVEYHDTQHASLRASKGTPMDLRQASNGRAPPRLIPMSSVSSLSLWHPSRFHAPASSESEVEVAISSAMTSTCYFIPVPCVRPSHSSDRVYVRLVVFPSSPSIPLLPLPIRRRRGCQLLRARRWRGRWRLSPYAGSLLGTSPYLSCGRAQNGPALVDWLFHVLRPSQVLASLREPSENMSSNRPEWRRGGCQGRRLRGKETGGTKAGEEEVQEGIGIRRRC
jgi:hypothetical protein